MKFCVIGIGRFGYHVAVTLSDHNMEVVAIDSNESIIASVRDKVTQAICMRVTDEESLRGIGVEEMDTVIVAMGENFSQSILITAILKQRLGVPNVIARAINSVHKDILQLIGADHVVLPEQEMGIRLADKLSLTFSNFIRITHTFSVSTLNAPAPFVDQKLGELNLRKQYKVICIGKKVDDDIIPLTYDYIIQEDDILVFAGPNQSLEQLTKI